MKHFTIRAILYYLAALVVSLTVCGAFNALLCYAMTWMTLTEILNSAMFIAGMALLETASCLYIVSSLSEDVLFRVEERTATAPRIKDKEGT